MLEGSAWYKTYGMGEKSVRCGPGVLQTQWAFLMCAERKEARHKRDRCFCRLYVVALTPVRRACVVSCCFLQCGGAQKNVAL